MVISGVSIISLSMIKEQINKYKVSAWWWASSVHRELNLQPELIKKLGREFLCTLSSGNDVCFRSPAEKKCSSRLAWAQQQNANESFFLLTFCVLYSKNIYYKAFRSIYASHCHTHFKVYTKNDINLQVNSRKLLLKRKHFSSTGLLCAFNLTKHGSWILKLEAWSFKSKFLMIHLTELQSDSASQTMTGPISVLGGETSGNYSRGFDVT